MKKIILMLATSAAPMLFASSVYCQAKQQTFKFTASDSTLIASNDAKPPATENTSEADAINSKAVRLFNKEFKNAEAVKWFKIRDGFVSYCHINGNKNKVFYDTRGNWTGSIVYYNDKTMPRDLRATIRSIYYDYSITQVEEIHSGDKVVFQVHLEDEKSWKIIYAADGEITLVNDFPKSLPGTSN